MGLPIAGTLREVSVNLRQRRASLFRALALPGALTLALQFGFWFTYSGWMFERWGLQVLLALFQGLVWALFAVSCHRVLLDDPDQPTPVEGLWLGSRQIRYVLMAIVVTIPILVYWVSIPWFIFFWFDLNDIVDVPRYVFRAFSWGLLLPLQYLSSRIALTLPAAALRQPMSFARAWSVSRGNGWRLTAILLAAPAAISLLSPFIERPFSTLPVVYAAFGAITSLIVGVVVVAGLSYSYKWFLNEYHLLDI